MDRLILAVSASLFAIAVQITPLSARQSNQSGGTTSCQDAHTACMNACAKASDIGDPDCMIRCRSTYDSCKSGGGTTAGQANRNRNQVAPRTRTMAPAQ